MPAGRQGTDTSLLGGVDNFTACRGERTLTFARDEACVGSRDRGPRGARDWDRVAEGSSGRPTPLGTDLSGAALSRGGASAPEDRGEQTTVLAAHGSEPSWNQ